MYEEWFAKVVRIAQHRYDIDGDILEDYETELENCWGNGFTPIRTVEYIANKIFA